MEDSIEETPKETFPQKRDIYSCLEVMAKDPKWARSGLNTIEENLKDLKAQNKLSNLTEGAYKARKGETVLHTSIKLFQFKSQEEKEVVELLISSLPKLILSDRVNTDYFGQTPLHMAVCKGNKWLVKTFFKNTVMMGQIPLTIAALTFNRDMFDLLVNKGANLDETNSLGDNVCHSLIRYGYLYPEKINDVLEMCRKLNDDPAPYDTSARAINNRKLRKKIWLMENKEGLNPLQLAATLGQHQIFSFIMDQEAYCFENSKDGLFDIKIYDVTEIDAISSIKSGEISGKGRGEQNEDKPVNISRKQTTVESKTFRKSILMMLFDLEPSVAFQFILFHPLMRVVNQKWEAYKKYFFPWWIFHTIFMFLHTWYSVERSKQSYNSQEGFSVSSPPIFKNKIPHDAFVTAYGSICIMVSVLYIAQEVRLVVKGKMPWTSNSFLNPYSSGWFRVMFILFGICLIIDFVLAIVLVNYENYFLIFAIVLGWFLSIFFIRAIKPFSFFTVMIQKILIMDMSRFFIIIGIEILAFATAMHMAIQGSSVADSTDYRNLWRTIFSMFSLMVGVGDMAAIHDTRHPTLCIIILVGFIIMTTLLMLNALIAMMSRTCMELVENVGNIRTRERHWKLQKLSVILFIEGILPDKYIYRVGECQEFRRYSNTIERRTKMKRYVLEVRSLQDANGDWNEDEEETINTTFGFKTVFNSLRNKKQCPSQRPFSGVSNIVRHELKQMSKKKKAKTRNADDDRQDRDRQPAEQIPEQVQSPVSRVFGLNPAAEVNASPNGDFAARNPRQEIDIYNFNLCKQCSTREALVTVTI